MASRSAPGSDGGGGGPDTELHVEAPLDTAHDKADVPDASPAGRGSGGDSSGSSGGGGGGSHAIEIKDLVCGYGKNQVLHGVDFSADLSKITAIVGSNGSGKSTLLKALFGLCDVKSGSIRAMDRDITHVPTHSILGYGISYMAQRKNVFQDLTLRENLAVVTGLRNAEQAMEHFPELLPFLDRPAVTLSGGQRQLLAMAMVLVHKPRIMLFDEPTAALSPKNADIIIGKIKDLNAEHENCIVLVEQNVKHALRNCDKVYLLASGNVVYSGDPATLLDDKDLASKYLGMTPQ